MIYTRKGDQGETSLFKTPKRLKKHEQVFEVLGSIDELNSFLGLLGAYNNKEVSDLIYTIQCDLFSISSYVANAPLPDKVSKIWVKKVLDMENSINHLDKDLPKLENFILSGGSTYAIYAHICRSICRNVERSFVFYITECKKEELLVFIPYINRLSDLLFVLARYINKQNSTPDVIWKP